LRITPHSQHLIDRPSGFVPPKIQKALQMALRMVALNRAPDGRWFARKGIPVDVDWRCRTLTDTQFRARLYNLCKDKYGHILSGNGRGWYEYTEKMMRGYARLKAEAEGIELYPDHPLIPKRVNALAEYMTSERFAGL